jgi:hypothetical protein
MAQDNKQICTIKIAFPVVSDEQALNIKKAITEALKDIPDANTQFSLMNLPTGRLLPPPQ